MPLSKQQFMHLIQAAGISVPAESELAKLERLCYLAYEEGAKELRLPSRFKIGDPVYLQPRAELAGTKHATKSSVRARVLRVSFAQGKVSYVLGIESGSVVCGTICADSQYVVPIPDHQY